MKLRHLAPLALSACLAAQTARDCSFGEWPFLVGNMDSQINTLVQAARNNDLDTIYINFFRATGPSTGTLWITDSAGTWNSAWGPVRTNGTGIHLVNLITAAHAQNLQVVAVMKCFDSTVQPSDQNHRQYLWNIVDYLVKSYDSSGKPVYDVDGIALDYVRYVGGSGVNPALVTDFVRGVKQRCGALSVHGYMITGRYDFDGPVYDGNFKSYTTVRDTIANGYGQHWEQLARWIDVFMPMAYTADGSIYNTYALHQAYVRTVTQYLRQACVNAGFATRRVSPTIRTYSDANETCTAATVEASITGALQGSGDGYQAFRYGTLAPHNDWMAKLKQYAAPGPNRPIPSFTAAASGLGTTLNAAASKDFDQQSATLSIRWDWENDGVFDTPFTSNLPQAWIARNPGAWRIGLEVKDATGQSGYTTRRLVVADVLSLTASTLSAAQGGQVGIQLNSGVMTAGSNYLVCGTLSGTTPGTQLAPGYLLPLNFDALTMGLIQAVNSPLLGNGLGVVGLSGSSTATFAVPPGLLSMLNGRTIHWAAIGADASVRWQFTTNARGLLITP
jgi:hypothetical protein